MEEKKDLAKAESKELSTNVVDLGFTGFEGVENDAGAFSIPFLKIASASSDELDEDHEKYIEGLKAGEFFNSITNEVYGKDINLIVVYSERVFNEYKPNRQGFVCTHPHAEGEALIRSKDEYPYVNKNTGNDLVETLAFIVLNADAPEDGVMVFSLSGTKLKHGKAFNSRLSMMKTEGGRRMGSYESIFNFATKKEINEKGSWYTVPKGNIKKVKSTPNEFAGAIKKAYELFKQEGVDYSKAEEQRTTGDNENPF